MNQKILLKKYLYIVLLIFAAVDVQAAPPTQQWAARYDKLNGVDEAVDVAVDSSGNSYVTGNSQNGTFYSNWATIKYNAAGTPVWTKIYNGPGNGYDKPAAIVTDSVGNVYVTGRSVGTLTNVDYATIKYAPNGTVLWTRIYNNAAQAGSAIDYATALAVDAAGNVYVTGVSSGGSCCGDDYVTIKYNAAGTALWTKRYNHTYSSTDIPTAIAVDKTGNVYVTGRSVGNASNYDYATIKYAANGTQLWVKRYLGIPTGAANIDYAKGIAIDGTGNIIVTGQSGAASSGSAGDYATVKYNPAGTQLWVKRFDGNAHYEDDAKAVAVDALGNIFVTGWSMTAQTGVQTLPAYATIKYSPAGVQLWSRLYRGAGKVDYATALALDTAGNVYVTGNSSVGYFGDYDYATVKYNTSGVQQWVKTYGGVAKYYDTPSAIAVNSTNNVFVTGLSYGTTTGNDFATIRYSQP